MMMAMMMQSMTTEMRRKIDNPVSSSSCPAVQMGALEVKTEDGEVLVGDSWKDGTKSTSLLGGFKVVVGECGLWVAG